MADGSAHVVRESLVETSAGGYNGSVIRELVSAHKERRNWEDGVGGGGGGGKLRKKLYTVRERLTGETALGVRPVPAGPPPCLRNTD